MPERFTDARFVEELPGLLAQRGLTLRSLAREVGGFDEAYLSRMLHGKRAVNPEHVARISQYLSFPYDYFPEVREARMIEAIQSDPKLRDEIYFARVATRRRRR
jgi:transcriptional regulator with XRE-family HTH domain